MRIRVFGCVEDVVVRSSRVKMLRMLNELPESGKSDLWPRRMSLQ